MKKIYHFGGNYKRIEGTTYYISRTGILKNSLGKSLKLESHNGLLRYSFRGIKCLWLHKEVYKAFVGEIPKGHKVKAIDGNLQNANVNNLFLRKSRQSSSFRKSKANSNFSKGFLSNKRQETIEMIKSLRNGVSLNDISKLFKISYFSIYLRIKRLIGKDELKKLMVKKCSASKRMENRQKVVDLPNEIWKQCGPNEEVSNFGRVIGPTGKVKTKKAPREKIMAFFKKTEIVSQESCYSKRLSNRQKVISIQGEIWKPYGQKEEISNLGRFIGPTGKVKKQKVPLRTLRHYFKKRTSK